MQSAWAYVGSGFALGAVVYYSAMLFLENKGAAVRLPTRFREYAIGRKQQNSKELLGLLSKCDLLRHLPPEGIEAILPYIRPRRLDAGEILATGTHFSQSFRQNPGAASGGHFFVPNRHAQLFVARHALNCELY